jgi:hypothetical protein
MVIQDSESEEEDEEGEGTSREELEANISNKLTKFHSDKWKLSKGIELNKITEHLILHRNGFSTFKELFTLLFDKETINFMRYRISERMLQAKTTGKGTTTGKPRTGKISNYFILFLFYF